MADEVKILFGTVSEQILKHLRTLTEIIYLVEVESIEIGEVEMTQKVNGLNFGIQIS